MKLDFDTNLPALTSAAAFANGIASTDATNEISQKLQAGVKAAQEGNRSEAKALLLQVTEIEPENENAWLWLASISEYPEELLVFLNNVLSVNPDNERAVQWAQATNALLSKTFVERGLGAVRDNQKSFARQCFLQATVHETDNEAAWLQLASISDSEEEKTVYLNKVLSFDPENEVALAALESVKKQSAMELLPQAIAEAFAGECGTGMETLEQILAIAPEMEDLWLLKSYLVPTVSEKIACFDKVLEINPENELARSNDNFLRHLTAKLIEPKKPAEEIEVPEQIYQVSDFEEIEVVTDLATNEEEEHAAIESAPSTFDKSETETFAECEDQEKLLGETYFAEIIPEDDDSFVQELSSKNNSEQESEQEFEPQPDENFETETEVNFQAEEENPAAETFEDNQQEIEVLVDSTDEEVPGNFDMPYKTSVEHDAEMNFTSQAEEIDKNFAEDEEIFDMPELPSAINGEAVLEEPEISADSFENNENSPVEDALPSYYEMNDEEEILSLISSDKSDSLFDSDEIEIESNEFLAAEEPVNNFPPSDLPETFSCPFCYAENEPQTFVCASCQAMLSLSNLDSLLAHAEGDNDIVRAAVEGMEAEKGMRQFSSEELKFLGIGLINLKKLPEGFECLQQAAQIAPDDVLLTSQTNALAKGMSEIVEKPDNQQNAAPKHKKILVVDDSATVRKLISGKLENSGHEVFCAVDGIDALEKIEEIMPDLILLDINMPRMDGYEACKLIRSNEKTKDVPVVMISGKDGFFDKVRGKMAGTTGYITKPFGPETLMKTVENYIV